MNKTKSPCIPCGRKWPHSRKQLLQPAFSNKNTYFREDLVWLVVWNIIYIFFSIQLGTIIPFDFHIFQRGWNHQPDDYGLLWMTIDDFWSLLIDCWGLSVSTFGSVLVFHRFPSLFSHQITELDLGHPGTPSRAAQPNSGRSSCQPPCRCSWLMDGYGDSLKR